MRTQPIDLKPNCFITEVIGEVSNTKYLIGEPHKFTQYEMNEHTQFYYCAITGDHLTISSKATHEHLLITQVHKVFLNYSEKQPLYVKCIKEWKDPHDDICWCMAGEYRPVYYSLLHPKLLSVYINKDWEHLLSGAGEYFDLTSPLLETPTVQGSDTTDDAQSK